MMLDEPVDRFGFQPVTSGARPRPQNAVLGDFVTNRTRFEALLGDKQTYKARNKIVRPATSDAQPAPTRYGGSAAAYWLQPKLPIARDAHGFSKTNRNLS